MLSNPMPPWLRQIDDQGFAIVAGAFSADQVTGIRAGLATALARRDDEAIRGSEGSIYAARNVLSRWPAAATVWRDSPLPEILTAVLGSQFGLVRALFFDKPPERTWALPWHKDLTIAVRKHHSYGSRFSKATTKAGVPHVEAPLEVLQGMLTARIHLDEVTQENGPLKVIPGSHHTGKTMTLGETPPHTIFAAAGDVLLMRPLLAHSSGLSHPETRRQRRILHLEFAATAELPDGYEWHEFRSRE